MPSAERRTSTSPMTQGPLANRMERWRDLNRRAVEQCIPLKATLETTLACNLRCAHCYNFDRQAGAVPHNAKAFLTAEEILDAMDQLASAGTIELSLTGGEVLIHPHLWRFLDHAKALHFRVALLTNGVQLTKDVVARVSSYKNICRVSISVYGASAAVADAFTRHPGGFDATISGIRRAQTAGLPVQVKFIITTDNVHEVDAMGDLAERLGVPFDPMTQITGRHDGNDNSTAQRISLDTWERLYRGPLGSTLKGPMRSRSELEQNWACACARTNVAITSVGNVQPCIGVPWSDGNIRERSFAEIWRTSEVFRTIRGYRLADYVHCQPCPLKAYCNRSNGGALMASGSYTGIDPWVCGEAKLQRDLYHARHGTHPS